MNASVIGSAVPFRQSMAMEPTIIRRSRLLRTISIISQSCRVERHSRDTSKVTIVSPGCAAESINNCCSLSMASPCSYSSQILSAPAARSSLTCRSISCLVSHVEHRAYPCVTAIPSAVFVTVPVSFHPLGAPIQGPRTCNGKQLFYGHSSSVIRRIARCSMSAIKEYGFNS